jgi:hypothetical protein
MQQWEYFLQPADNYDELAKLLPHLGVAGWELVCVVEDRRNMGVVHAYFKRPAPLVACPPVVATD